jgi:enoyl-CoA hydratase
LAAELAAGPIAAQRLAMQVIDAGLETTLDAGLELEQDAFVAVFATEDARIGVASFLESGPGKAIFTGR